MFVLYRSNNFCKDHADSGYWKKTDFWFGFHKLLNPVPDLKNTQNAARVDFRSAATSGRQYSAQAIFNSKLGTTIHLKKHLENDYFIIHLKKILIA